MLTSVVALALPGVAPFELGVVCEVFGIDRRSEGVPAFDFAVVTERPGRVPTSMGFSLDIAEGLDRASTADLVVVPARPPGTAAGPAVTELLRHTVDRGARVLSVCAGAFVLGEAGLLDGRRCTTHWMHAAALAEQYPSATVDPDVLYVDSDPVITSAGTAAGVDACLYVVRKEFLVTAPLVLVVLSADDGFADTEFDVGRVVQSLTLAASALGLASCVATFHPAANVSAAAALVHAGPGWLVRHALSLGRAAPVVRNAPLAVPTGRLPIEQLLTLPPSAHAG